MKKISIIVVVLFIVAGVMFALTSCGEKTPEEKFFGPELTNKSEYLKATVNDVYANGELMEKNVVLEVTIGDVCPAGCWFFIKDNPEDKIELKVTRNKESFTVPGYIKGKKALVYGKVSAESSGEMLEGHRVELID